MPADFQGQYAAAANINFQQRIAAALRAAAITVYNENPATPGHAARTAYAVKVAQSPPLAMLTPNQFGSTSPDELVLSWAFLLAAEGLDNSSSDATITAQIAAAWSAMAGA